MKSVCIYLILLGLIISPMPNTIGNLCRYPRPTACTDDYNPVCGISGMTKAIFSNWCMACSNPRVLYWRTGQCTNNFVPLPVIVNPIVRGRRAVRHHHAAHTTGTSTPKGGKGQENVSQESQAQQEK
jgi:hypothetical protein